MKKVLALLSIMLIAMMASACYEENPVPATQTPAAATKPAPAAPAPAPPSTPTPIVLNPNPTTGPVPSPSGSGPCSPVAITTISQREPATVNNTAVRLQVRDTDACARPLFYNETGVSQGSNYKLSLPKGWTAITASVSAEIQRNGGQPRQFKNGPVVVVRGPFVGGAGLYEGAIRIVPDEWVSPVLDQTLKIQRQQVGNPNLQPVNFDG